MAKYDLGKFKQKISPREGDEVKQKAASRFNIADEVLGITDNQEEDVVPKSFARIVRKTFSIPENELQLIGKVREKALNKRVVLADSEIVRIGLLIASELSDEKLEEIAGRLEKMPMGRPSTKSKKK